MKTIEELKLFLVETTKDQALKRGTGYAEGTVNLEYANLLPKREYVELGRNIDFILSPKTGKRITLGTFVSYTIPYKNLHSWEQMSRPDLASLFLNLLKHYRFEYLTY
jgi:hypothetical protein